MLTNRYDDLIRSVVFVLTGIAASILALSIGMRLTRHPRLLTKGQLRAQVGFFFLLVSAFYGVGEGLWGWYHLRLWLLLLATFFSVIGCVGMLGDAMDERRHPAGPTKG